ncbi:MAG: gliding motility-associated C-terminal domain-containing protein [Saprospiraceae bacterium]
MGDFYNANALFRKFCWILFFIPSLASGMEIGDPTDPDSLLQRGHCSTVIEVDTNCATGELQLSAYILWTFSQLLQPVAPTWNTGEVAHKINVVPPGTWSWDPGITTCEIWHQFSEVTYDGSFFPGPIEITGPTTICPEDFDVELTLNINGYSEFESLVWSPPNPTGFVEPYPITNGGTYSISVIDAFGCTSSDQITIVKVAPYTVDITGTSIICPEGDTATLNVVNPGQYSGYEWSSGETTSPINVTSPGSYQVTATDVYGCTGVGTFGVQSAGVDPFDISVSSPTLCPGDVDTLRVLGGFINYSWSNNVMGITNIVNQAGTYTVTVTNPQGCTETSSATVTDLQPPDIQIIANPFCVGDATFLHVEGGNFPAYDWSSGQQSDTIFVSTPGTYSVTVSGTGICATSTNVQLDFAESPTTEISPPETINCYFPEIELDASNSSSGAGFSINWSTPDGNIISGQDSLFPIVDLPGTYILNIVNDSTGCVSKDTVLVPQNISPPQANAGPEDTLTCSFQHLNIGPFPTPIDSNLMPHWVTPDGHILSGDSTWSPDIDQPGWYLLSVQNINNGCISTDSVQISQDVWPPVVSIASPDLITCMEPSVALDGTGSSSGPEFQYFWSSPDGVIDGPTNSLNTSTSTSGIYILQIINTTNGCVSSDSVFVAADVNLPVLVAETPETLTCVTNPIEIDATMSSSGPTYQYNWTTSDGNIINGGNSLMPTVDAPGTYVLHLVNTANNCMATLDVEVLQNIAPPVADPGLEETLNCLMTNVVLDGNASSSGPNFTYQWSTPDGNIASGDDSLNPVVDVNGTYNLEVTNTLNGCTANASVLVLLDTISPLISIANPNLLTCSVLQTTLDGTGSDQTPDMVFNWNGPIVSGQGTLQAEVDQPGLYNLDITNTLNGCSSQLDVLVEQDITLPTAEAGSDALINCTDPTGILGTMNNPSGTGYSILWSTSNGNILSALDSGQIVIDQAGNYELMVQNLQNGCVATDTVVVTDDFVPPMADAGPGAVLTCIETAHTLQGSGSVGPEYNYLWTTIDGQISSGDNTLMPTVSEPGLYTLVVTNTNNGCTAESQVTILDNSDGPVADAGLPQTLTCTFTNTTLSIAGSSTGPEFTYSWTTTDGNITNGSNTQSPEIDAPGTYTLLVTNTSNQCTETAEVIISQDIQEPVIDAGPADLLTCAITSLNLQAELISSSSQNIAYSWNSSDGQIAAGANTASPVISAPGAYQLTVTDAVNGCTGEDQVMISQDITEPAATIEMPPVLTCAVLEINLDATQSSSGTMFEYSWNSGNGHIVSGQDQLVPVVDEPGDYALIITNTDNGCTQSATVMVLQDIQAPLADAGQSVGLDCNTQTSSLDGSASSQGAEFSYSWSTTDGIITTGANTTTPVIADEGYYFLTVFNSDNGCKSIDSVLVTIDTISPSPLIATPQILTCNLLSITLDATGADFGSSPDFSWSTGTGNILNGATTQNPVVDAPGIYVITVQNTENGCTGTVSVSVSQNIVQPPIDVADPPLLTCSVLQFPLQSIVPNQCSVSWSTNDGHIVSGSSTISPVVDQAGLYQIVATDNVNGCTNTAEVEVLQELNVPSGLDYALMLPLCNGTPGQLNFTQVDGGVGPYAYSINGGATFFAVDEFNNLSPGSYMLVIQDANGCEVADDLDIPVPLDPDVSLPFEFSINLGEFQQLNAEIPLPFTISLIDTVIWHPLTGLTFTGTSIPELLSPIAQPFRSTDYTVTIVTEEGCTAEARTRILVNREIAIYVPNIIWPEDPDGNNSVFAVYAREASIANIKLLQVFDRWGSLVFEQRDFLPNLPSLGWNGEVKGKPVNPGVFVWYLEAEMVDGQTVLLKGDVTVMR